MTIFEPKPSNVPQPEMEYLDPNTVITFAHLYGATFTTVSSGLICCSGNRIASYGHTTADAARSWLKLRGLPTSPH